MRTALFSWRIHTVSKTDPASHKNGMHRFLYRTPRPLVFSMWGADIDTVKAKKRYAVREQGPPIC